MTKGKGARDKQIVIRLEETTRDALKTKASEYGGELGFLLYQVASGIASGKVSFAQLLDNGDISNDAESRLASLEKEMESVKKPLANV